MSRYFKFFFDSLAVIAAGILLIIGALYFLGAWNMQWSTGHLLIPTADDWQDIDAFANYLTGRSYFNLIFLRYMGHPEFFVKLIAFLYLKLGFYSYKEVIAVNVILQLIPTLVFAWVIKLEKRIPLPLKCLLISLPLIFMFSITWWGFFHVVKGFLWSYGYVFAYLALFAAIGVDRNKKGIWPIAITTCLAFIVCQFFVAGYAIWPALCFLAYSGQWPRRNYFILLSGMLFSFLIYVLMVPGSHDMTSRVVNFFERPLQLLGYTILLFGDDGVINHEAARTLFMSFILQSCLIFFLTLFFIIKYIIYPPRWLFERFNAALLIFSFLIICLLAYGRLETSIKTSPFHYAPCVLALYIPLIAVIAIECYKRIDRWAYPLVVALVSFYLFHAGSFPYLISNAGSFSAPSRAPDYERISLMCASLIDLPSFQGRQPAAPNEPTFVNTLANNHYGFARWPALSYMGKTIISSTQTTCPGELTTHQTYQFSKWEILELTGWSWDTLNDTIPKWVLITNDKNKVIGTAEGEMTQVLRQTNKNSTWLAYVPYEKLQHNPTKNIKIWLTDGHKYCFVKAYSSERLQLPSKKTSIYVVSDLKVRGFIP